MDISDEIDQIDNSEPLGGEMDGMDDMNTPPPPMDTGTPPPPPMEQPEENPGDMGADPMPDDPNSLNAGDPMGNEGGDDISQKYQKLSPDQQKAADKYIDSMMNNESTFSFKKIIDEMLGDDGDERPIDKGTTRTEKKAVIDVKDSPYMP